MMKKYILILLALSSIMGMSCKKGLSDANQNPNAPENIDPQFLLSNVLYQTAKNNAEEGWKNANLLAQHTSNIEFFPIDRYDVGSNTELWNALYRLLNDVKSIETSPQTNNAYKGLALILRSLLASELTDLWNDVPYSEAVKSIFAPAYDKQEDIYRGPQGILANLDKAIQMLSSTPDAVSGDILYGGNLDKWQRLAWFSEGPLPGAYQQESECCFRITGNSQCQ